MKSYPIWINVESCIYKSSKSYGAKDINEQTILVGSSFKNSHALCTIVNHKKSYEEYKGFENVIVFKTKIDGVTVKEMIFKDNKGKAGEKLKTICHLNQIKKEMK